uniref:NSFL1 cofactor p47 n=1 Tax=Lygus hesperus TaxID=30085 RepID=A0A0A9XLY1_LYGHE
MSDNDQILREFCGITGATTEDGRFYLESSVWNLENALASYYESVSGGSPTERSRDRSESPEFMDVPPPKAAEASSKKKAAPTDRPRIATLSSMKKQESDSDEEEGQRFYAGGSTHSGQEVLGPGRASHDLISELFRSARELGGVESAPAPKQNKFGGVGYRLGMTSDDTQAVGESGNGRQRRELTLRLWRDGFTINEEPLRSYTDPDDREFLRKIRSGQVPPELVEDSANETLHLNMEDHRHENYPAPARPTRRAFAGTGHMLGSVAPTVITSETAPASVAPETPADLPPKPAVDDKAPTTTISIRLADGSRVQATLNHSHTIQDLRAYLVNLRPELSRSNFLLLTTFPSKELSDNTLTLKDAGILNSSILMRLK